MLCSSFVLHGVHGASVYCSGWCWIRIWLEIWLLCWCVGTAKANLDIQFSGLIQSKSSFSNSLVCTKDQLLLGRAGVRLSGTSRLWTLLLRIAREDTTASQHQGLRLLNQVVCLLGTLGVFADNLERASWFLGGFSAWMHVNLSCQIVMKSLSERSCSVKTPNS